MRSIFRNTRPHASSMNTHSVCGGDQTRRTKDSVVCQLREVASPRRAIIAVLHQMRPLRLHAHPGYAYQS